MNPPAVPTAEQPIGVFDSGLGGLTVVRALRQLLPPEHVLYLGDTARVPYGSKSAETVIRYSQRSAAFLLGRGVKLLLVACNTASAAALDTLAKELPVPVLGAVEPGAEEAVAQTTRGQIGVIGTLGTVRSGAYVRAIAARDPKIRVAQLACPLFVPFVEEGWLGDRATPDDRAVEIVAERYLGELSQIAPELDVLVLGCTHYPLLRPLLERTAEKMFGRRILLVDSANAMARAARRALDEKKIARVGDAGPLACFLTDEARFAEVGARFLGHALDLVEKVDL